jgi:hypothetical protein
MNSLEAWLSKENDADRRYNVSRRSKLLGRVVMPLVAMTAAGASLFMVHEADPDSLHPYDVQGVHREYTVRPGDSVFGIATEAEIGDARDVSRHIIDTLEVRDHVNEQQATSLQVGEIIPLPVNAAIGQLVTPSQPSR